MKTSRENILDLQVEKGEFYLYDLMKRVLDTYKEQCVLRQIELYVGPCENRLLYGDIDRSQEIFENLFENAFKYGDGRLIEITFYEEDGCQLIQDRSWKNVNLCICLKAFIVAAMHNTKTAMG